MKLPPERKIEHIIEVKPNSTIVNIKPYRYPHHHETEIERLIQDLLKCGVITTSRSPYAAPVILVRKNFGLKQAPKAWYSRIDTYLQQMGFEKSEADPNLYYIVVGDNPLILVFYVDDLFIIGAEKLVDGCKQSLDSEFDMKDIRLMHYFLGLKVWQKLGHIFLGHGKYVVDILKRFQMEDCKPMSTPMITN
jgi:hypothetical protein